MGSSFVPNSDFGEFSVWLDMDAGLTLDSAVGWPAPEQIIRQHPEVLSNYVSTSAENARIFVQLTGKSQRDASLEEIAAQMRQQCGPAFGLQCRYVVQPPLLKPMPGSIVSRGMTWN